MHYAHTQIVKSFQELFNLNIKDEALVKVYYKYQETYRYYHNDKHIDDVILNIVMLNIDKMWTWKEPLDNINIQKLIIAALFHDIIYNPNNTLSDSNEKQSADYFKFFMMDDNNFSSKKTDTVNQNFIEEIYQAILDTEYKKPFNELSNLGQYLMIADCRGLLKMDFSYPPHVICAALNNEDLLRKEFQKFPYLKYKQGKVKFLDDFEIKYKEITNHDLIDFLKNYVIDYKPSFGVFAGSFNPFHAGHLDILKQAENNFEKVIIVVANNQSKESVESTTHRLEKVRKILPHHEVISWEGPLHVFLEKYEKENGVNLTLVRGLRNSQDFESENTLQWAIHTNAPNVKFAYYISNPEYTNISSSLIKEMEASQLDTEKLLVTKEDAYGIKKIYY